MRIILADPHPASIINCNMHLCTDMNVLLKYLDLMDPMHIWIYQILLVFFVFNSALVNVDGQDETEKKPEIICDFTQWFDIKDLVLVNVCDNKTSPDNHNVYCHGPLLQAANYFKLGIPVDSKLDMDSKTFVDRQLKRDAKEVSDAFDQQFNTKTAGFVHRMTKEDLEKFVEENFYPIDQEAGVLEECKPTDWSEKPRLLEQISDPTMREFAMKLNALWNDLCRQIKKGSDNTKRSSLIHVSNPFIVPGGRFREYYYWDSLWTIKGLLASGMVDTTKMMLENFFELVERYKFVPNGGRVYYSMRSQPPLLTSMVHEYYKHTGDKEFLFKAMPVLEQELEFWEKNRIVYVNIMEISSGNHALETQYKMFHYQTESTVPRPESFCKDVNTASKLSDPSKAKELWQNLASAAESGWDFSTRWMKNPENPKLEEIETTRIVPVDLNGYMCGNYRLMALLYSEIGKMEQGKKYFDKYISFRYDFNKVFFHDGGDQGKTGWYDYHLDTEKKNMEFYAAMIVPLYMRCYDVNKHSERPQQIYDTMEKFGAFEPNDSPDNVDKGFYGVPTSMRNSTQQWDLPNIWPPLNHMIFDAFHRSYSKTLRQRAFKMASDWIFANYILYKCCDQMFEKLSTDGKAGGGGEYVVQAGFGWTNGAILDLLVRYKDIIKYTGGDILSPSHDKCKDKCKPKGSKVQEDPNNQNNQNNLENHPEDPTKPKDPEVQK